MRGCFYTFLVFATATATTAVAEKTCHLSHSHSHANVRADRVPTLHRQSILHHHDEIPPPSTRIPRGPSSRGAVILRGGGIRNKPSATSTTTIIVDSNVALALKMLVGSMVETCGILGIIVLGKLLSSNKLPHLPQWQFGGLHWGQWMSLFTIVFNSSFVSSILIDNNIMSAATNQVLKPNTVPNNPEWYMNLQKPKWNPPGFVFPIMWLLISKPTQLLALRKLLLSTNDHYPWKILALYCGHLALGNTWNKVFFGCQRIGLGVVVISIFFSMLCGSAYLFRTIDVAAGNLLLPTCAWVFVATSLNWSIFFLNKDKTKTHNN